jgi:hypothetical protein
MATFITLAIVDDVHSCDCCGKSNLKSTVAMERDDGAIVHFGSICATRHAGRAAAVIRREAASMAAQKQAAADLEFRASAEKKAYDSKLAEARAAKIIPGRTFADYVRKSARAAQEMAVLIAAKHGVARVSA